MQLLYKNQENFCLSTVFHLENFSKNRPSWPTFGFSNPKITEVVWVRFSIFSIFENFFDFFDFLKGVPPLKFSKNFPKNRKFLYFFFRNRPTSAPKLLAPKILYQMRPIRALKYFSTARYGTFFRFSGEKSQKVPKFRVLHLEMSWNSFYALFEKLAIFGSKNIGGPQRKISRIAPKKGQKKVFSRYLA